jgi:plasmid maintenance system antidote protein VapI
LFGSTPEFWMRLQAACDLKKAQQNKMPATLLS